MAFPGDEGTVNLIGVVAGPVNLLGRDAAMPDATGLVFQIIEAVTVNRIDRIMPGIEMQNHSACVFGIQREVISLLLFDKAYSQWIRSSFFSCPAVAASHGERSEGW